MFPRREESWLDDLMTTIKRRVGLRRRAKASKTVITIQACAGGHGSLSPLICVISVDKPYRMLVH